MSQIDNFKAVTKMLNDFNKYFSYLHGKSTAVEIEMPEIAVLVWLRVYSELSPEERDRAQELVYEKCTFHPSPEQFRQLVKGTPEAEALKEWLRILEISRMASCDAIPAVEVLSHRARQALRIVGGLSGLGNCPEASLHKSVKEDFCKAWIQVGESTTVLGRQCVTEVSSVEASVVFAQSKSTPMIPVSSVIKTFS
ncbi:MAG: hypothetical protein ACREPR_24165 [Brasilonema sp.]